MTRPIAPPLRLMLAPSRGLRIAVLVLVIPAAIAIHLSALPDTALVVLPALAWWAWRAVSRGLPAMLVLRSDGTAVQLDQAGDEHPVQPLALHERGPLGTLVLSVEGRRRHLAWAADTLPRGTRRELRLWMRDHAHHSPRRKSGASSPGTPNA